MFRFDIINALIQRYGYKSYLEIGVEGGIAFSNVQCDIKHGVDPFSANATFRIPSDDFFAMINDEVEYDIIFVDGLHVEDQAQRDIENSLLHLSEGGVIVVHDCNPPTEWHQRSYEEFLKHYSPWNGTTWRGFVNLRATRPDLEMCVIDTDWGCGIVRQDGEGQDLLELPDREYTYADFEANREEWLNMISVDEFIKTLA